jgi:hypothetical protein
LPLPFVIPEQQHGWALHLTPYYRPRFFFDGGGTENEVGLLLKVTRGFKH